MKPYSKQNDTFTITDIRGQGGLWRIILFLGGGFTFWNLSKTNHHVTRKGERYRFGVLLFAQFFSKNSSSGYAISGVFHTQQTTSDTLQSDTSGEANNDFVLPLRTNHADLTNNAKQIRGTYFCYFNSEGKVE